MEAVKGAIQWLLYMTVAQVVTDRGPLVINRPTKQTTLSVVAVIPQPTTVEHLFAVAWYGALQLNQWNPVLLGRRLFPI